MRKIIYLLFFATESNVNVYSQEKPNVIITGKFTDKIPLFARIKSDDAALTPSTRYFAKINPDSTFIIHFHIPKPMPVILVNQMIFCEPGDSVNVLINGKLPWPKMEFDGDKAYRYNFIVNFFDSNEASRVEEEKVLSAFGDESKFLLPYKKKLYEYFSKKKSLLAEYSKRYPISDYYERFVYSKIYYPYLSSLLVKYGRVKDADERTTLGYFKEITPAKLQNEKFINSWDYSYCLFSYLTGYWAKPNPNASITATIKQQFDFVKSEFKESTKDILLARLFVSYFEKGNPEYYDFIIKEYQESKQTFFHKDYHERLIPLYTRYMMFDLDLSKDTKTLFRKISGEGESLAKVMHSLKGNIVYLDLWASWCVPCREEMPYSEKLTKAYAGKNVKFIYLSTDEKIDMWKKAFSELKMDSSYSFLLDNSTKALFSKTINLAGIPRYILIDKEGKIVDGDAPRPSDPKIVSLIDEYLR